MAADCAIVTIPVGSIPKMPEDEKKGRYSIILNS